MKVARTKMTMERTFCELQEHCWDHGYTVYYISYPQENYRCIHIKKECQEPNNFNVSLSGESMAALTQAQWEAVEHHRTLGGTVARKPLQKEIIEDDGEDFL